MKSIIIIFMGVLVMYSEQLFSQPFTPDTTWQFDHIGVNTRNPGGLLIQDDGKAVVHGSISHPTIQPGPISISRFFLETGLKDPTFAHSHISTRNIVQISGGYISTGQVFAKLDNFGQTVPEFYLNYIGSVGGNAVGKGGGSRIFIYPDGRMLLGCGHPCLGLWFKPEEHQAPFRIFDNGLVDSSFNITANGSVYNIISYNDNQLLICGLFTEYGNVPKLGIARIDTAGNLDTSFQSVFAYPSQIYLEKGHVEDDGKIMVKGLLHLQGNDTIFGLVRLLPDGSIDESFKKVPGAHVLYSHKTSDGGYLIGGGFTEVRGIPRGKIAKLDANGNLEEGYFNGIGFEKDIMSSPVNVNDSWITRIAYHEPDDNYYIVGQFDTYNGIPVPRVVRFKGLISGTTTPEKFIKSFTIHPNPATESINIQLPENITGKQNVQVEILNQLGQRVLYQKLDNTTVSVGHLSAGMYFVNLQSDGVVFQPQKLVVY